MRLYSHCISLSCIVLLAACASNEPIDTEVEQQAPSVEEAAAVAEMARQEAIKANAEAEAEAKARAEAAQAEALRQQEIALEAKRKAEAEAEKQAELARQQEAEAQRQIELARQQVAEEAAIIARQQARIDELRAKIAKSSSAVSNLDEANELLQDAVVAAESLTNALGEEHQKYSSVDPASGEMLEEIATTTLDELTAEMERLRVEAQALIDASK